MDSATKLMTTGEFADLCGVKKQTLFHYDEIGLLEPEWKDEKGYRYYSIQQTEAFTVIAMLKEIGLSLGEIKSFLQSNNAKKTMDLLTEQEKLVEIKIQKMNRIQQFVQNQVKQIKQGLQLDLDQFTIEDMETAYLGLSENILNSSYRDIASMIISFMEYIKQGEINIDNWGALIGQRQIEEGDYLNYSHFYLHKNQLNLTKTFTKKAGKYVIGYHQGSYMETYQTYDKIKDYLDKEGYRICGDSFEEYLYLMGGPNFNTGANYVIRIMIQVEEDVAG
ncbi:MerR family transcriptional regulator [Virgibacillus sp. NKC19-3]|uniref:MerR family transcriptional regulator n=1 Tax=Virgibacillus saliphilus TaxID=2831674 RepID=UPI001C9B7F89|nr:MerR family transcriptional regulator [Virgibacillus sp. NKC19-3]MBY7141978.1 MerR family transcriptional regulator [Virgibacillus sp. NKC19-3]